MHRSEFIQTNNPIYNYLAFPSDASPSVEKTAKKVDRSFDSLMINLHIFKARIENALNSIFSGFDRNHLFGSKNILVKSENHAKYSEAGYYRQFAREPVQIKPAGLDVMSQLGIDTESPGIETAKRLSPRMIDAGKCFGASHAFIRDSLDQEVPLIATKYEGGVPLEGVLTQEIHTRYWEESSETRMQTELEWGISTILEETSYNPDTYSHLTEEQQDILKDVHQLASRGGSPTLEQIEEARGAKLTPENRASLERVFTIPGLARQNQAIARLNGLEVDWSSGIKSAQEIQKAVSELQTGSYGLTFPVADSRGFIIGFHMTSLVINRKGESYFYDPNYAVARTNNPEKTVGRIFQHYTGYGKNIDLYERIKNRFFGRAKIPVYSSGVILHRFSKI